MNIKQELLTGIIEEYIKSKEPIGSAFLKQSQSFCVSSATIRNYFKILEKEGALFQPHVSSGRIPTLQSLSTHWRCVLNYLLDSYLCINIKKLDSITKIYGIFCVILPKSANLLLEIINCENGYLILKFSRGEIAIATSEPLLRFLQPFVNMDIMDITQIATQVGANDLALKLIALEQVDMAKSRTRSGTQSLKEILESKYFADIYSGRILLKKGSGIYVNAANAANIVPSGYLAVIHDVINLDTMESKSTDSIESKSKVAKMLSFGGLERDFKSFYTELAV